MDTLPIIVIVAMQLHIIENKQLKPLRAAIIKANKTE
jgi:hypothetical protein